MPIKKIPPPPVLTDPQFQAVNRWLLEIQRVFNAGGFIEAAEVVGLVAAYVQLAALAVALAALTVRVTALENALTALTVRVAALETALAALTVRVTALEARNQVLNGNGAPAAGLGAVNDWYADVSATKHIYVKTAPTTWTLIV